MTAGIQTKTSGALNEYVADQVATIRAIPEGTRLANYPEHDDTTSCWCHPRVVWTIGESLLQHKNLHNGEFDS